MEFSKLLVEKADVAVSPGLGFGEYGEGFVRIALVENEHRIRQAARNIKKFLARSGHDAQRHPARAQGKLLSGNFGSVFAFFRLDPAQP